LQGDGLEQGSRIPVENPPICAVRLPNAIAEYLIDQIVANEFACGDLLFGLASNCRFLFYFRTKKITSGNLRNFEPTHQCLRLCALSGAWSPQKDKHNSR